MKITKKQLKKIIEEELGRVMSESERHWDDPDPEAEPTAYDEGYQDGLAGSKRATEAFGDATDDYKDYLDGYKSGLSDRGFFTGDASKERASAATKEPVLDAEDLGLEEGNVEMNEISGVTLGLGAALGAATMWAGPKLTRAAASILGRLKDSAEQAFDAARSVLTDELRAEIQAKVTAELQNDAELKRLADIYQALSPTDDGHKDAARAFAEALETAINTAWENLPDEAASVQRHLAPGSKSRISKSTFSQAYKKGQ